MLNNSISSGQICELISSEHNKKYQVLTNNKVLNEMLAQNQSKIRCPFCDQIFDVNVQDKVEDDSGTINGGVKCPNVSAQVFNS